MGEHNIELRNQDYRTSNVQKGTCNFKLNNTRKLKAQEVAILQDQQNKQAQKVRILKEAIKKEAI